MNRMKGGVQSGTVRKRVMSGHGTSDDYAPDISVVIATRGRPRELAACLEALEKQTYYDFEIVVVDSAPPVGDESTREIAGRFNARYLREERPGSSRARNLGAREAAAPIIAFTDDDALPEPDWLQHITTEFEDPTIAAVVGKTLAIPSETEAASLFERTGGFVNGGAERSEFTRDTPSWFPFIAFHGLGMLANMAVRQSYFLRSRSEGWHGFDERLGRGSHIHGFDENYALFSLVHEGKKVVYSPAVEVLHPGPAIMEELRKEVRMNNSAGTAFFCLLAVEHPSYWGKLLEHLFTKVQSSGKIVERIPQLDFSLSERFADRVRGMGWYVKAISGS